MGAARQERLSLFWLGGILGSTASSSEGHPLHLHHRTLLYSMSRWSHSTGNLSYTLCQGSLISSITILLSSLTIGKGGQRGIYSTGSVGSVC